MKYTLPALFASLLLAAAVQGAAPTSRFNLKGSVAELAHTHTTSDNWTWQTYVTVSRYVEGGKERTYLDFYYSGCAAAYYYCEAHFGWGTIPNEQFSPKPNSAILEATIADGPEFTVLGSAWGPEGEIPLEKKTGTIRLTWDQYGRTLQKIHGTYLLAHSGGVTTRANENSETRSTRLFGNIFEMSFSEGDGVLGKAGTNHSTSREWQTP